MILLHQMKLFLRSQTGQRKHKRSDDLRENQCLSNAHQQQQQLQQQRDRRHVCVSSWFIYSELKEPLRLGCWLNKDQVREEEKHPTASNNKEEPSPSLLLSFPSVLLVFTLHYPFFTPFSYPYLIPLFHLLFLFSLPAFLCSLFSCLPSLFSLSFLPCLSFLCILARWFVYFTFLVTSLLPRPPFLASLPYRLFPFSFSSPFLCSCYLLLFIISSPLCIYLLLPLSLYKYLLPFSALLISLSVPLSCLLTTSPLFLSLLVPYLLEFFSPVLTS